MKLSYALLLLVLFSSSAAQVKTWKQTSAADFSQGSFDRVTVPPGADGELRFIHPFVQTAKDSLDSAVPKCVGFDDAGNYLHGWITTRMVYVRKYNAFHQPLSDVIRVDLNARAQNSDVALALLNDGRCVVGWVESSDSVMVSAYPAPRFCQFFTAAMEKSGAPVRVFKLNNATNTPPAVIADQRNRRFLILGNEYLGTNWFQEFGMFFSASGIKLRDSVKIVPSDVPVGHYSMHGACRNGVFAFAWINSTDGMGPNDIHFALADSNAILTTIPVQVNDSLQQGNTGIPAFDDAGNSCVTWTWSPGYTPGPPSIVFCQAFDTVGRRLGDVVRMTTLAAGSVYWQHVSSANAGFRLTYALGFSNGQPETIHASSWKVFPVTFGNHLSAIFDAGSLQTDYGQLSWEGIMPPSTRLKFQVRAAAAKEEIPSLPWMGPSSASDYFLAPTGESIHPSMDGKRYMQVRTILEADSNGQTPILHGVSVTYTTGDNDVPLAVTNAAAQGEHRRVVLAWQKSPTPDVRTYRVYRALDAEPFNGEPFAVLPAQAAAFVDSSVAYDSTYRYGIAAVDSSFNESPVMETDVVSPKAATVYVSQSGSSPEDGTIMKPFLSINNALAYAFRGDTILVLPGEYAEDVVLAPGIALIGSGAPVTKIISSSAAGALKTAPHCLVKGFTFLVTRGIVGGGDDVTITENILIHQGSGMEVGIVTGIYERVVISKNIIMNFGVGIQARAFPTSPKTMIMIRNNILYGPMGVSQTRRTAEFYNNTFIVTGMGRGLMTDYYPTVIMNNCFAGYHLPTEYSRGIDISYGKNVTAEYNNQWNFNAAGGDTLSATNFAADPRFVSATKNNYRLGAGSPCIDAGNPLPQYNDKDGSRNDVGAYGGPDPMPAYLTLALATELSLKAGSGFPGDTIAVDIVLGNASGLAQGDAEIVFDGQRLAFIDAAGTPLTSDFTVSSRALGAGRVLVHLEHSEELVSGNGSIAALRFRIHPSSGGGVHSAVEPGSVRLLDGEGNAIIVSSVASGVVAIKSLQQYPRRVYVDGTNTGASDGTVLRPFPTVQQAIAAAKAGDTVYIGAGRYKGPVVMRSGVYVKGSGAGVTTISCEDGAEFTMKTVVAFDSVRNTGISGCTLLNTAAMGTLVEASASDAVIAMNRLDQSAASMYMMLVHSGSRVTISDNYFVESKNGGMSMIDVFSGEAVIARNVFVPAAGMEAVVVRDGARATIRNNRFTLATEGKTGIAGRRSKHMLVANNVFIGRPSAGSGVKLADAESTTVVNNIFDVGQTGLDVSGGYQLILNNVFIGCAIGMNAAAPAVHRYNFFSANGINNISGAADPTELTGDPQFADRAKGNYRPAPASRLIDAGDPSAPWTDADGTRNDIGLYGGPCADPRAGGVETVRLRIGNTTGAPGDTVTVPVIASGLIDMSGMQLMIEFDAVRLSLLNVRTAAATRSFSILRKNVGQTIVSVQMTGSDPLIIDSAVVAELRFIVLAEAKGNAFVKFQNAYVISGAAEPMSVADTEGGIVDLTPTAIIAEEPAAPAVFSLSQNYPNPFNPSTTIRFTVPRQALVDLALFDILGRQVAVLAHGNMRPGTYTATVHASSYASGIYFYRLQAGGFVQTRKMILMK